MNKQTLLLIGISSLLLSACTLKPTTPATPSDTSSQTDTSTTQNTQAFALTEQNSSGQTGSLTLTETPEGKTMAVLELTGGDFTEPQPAHIHEGACPTPGDVKFPLSDVVDGKSTTVLDMPLNDVLASAPFLAVNIHKSGAESDVYTACGNLKLVEAPNADTTTVTPEADSASPAPTDE